MLPVASVERSAEFYKLLGFEVGNRVPRTGLMNWAWLYSPTAADWRQGPNLMIARCDGPIQHPPQRIIFYLYAADLVGLRNHLIDSGLTPGPITYPDYMPKGEFHIFDYDGHGLMIGQSFEDSP